jgi:hypothetical protein
MPSRYFTEEINCMTLSERLWQVLDPVGLGRSSARVLSRMALRPGATFEPTARFVGGLIQASAVTAGRLVGVDAEGPLAPAPQDGRFADEAWSKNATFYGLLQLYLLGNRLITELVEVVARKRSFGSMRSSRPIPTNGLLAQMNLARHGGTTGSDGYDRAPAS